MKKLIKRLIHSLGYDLHRLNVNTWPEFQLFQSLKKFEINLVLDIGANEGQFATEIRTAGYKGQIISYEPLSDAHNKAAQAAKRDKYWIVHPQAAIGDYDGNVEINISGNSVSSSVLPMTETHSEAALNSAYIGTENVPIHRLDTIATKYLSPEKNIFIKIDTQGFEWKVLDGATETLKNAKGVLCEMSLVPLYNGQHLWGDMLNRFESEGFTLWAIQRGFTDPRDGRSLQINAIFFRL
ncbi:MAG: FkbM family methyltransferase [Bacteroidetes bacterium]|nr:FkbM family methyltransferase [Bacteroidota bacterium]